jgi:hypothetical protein
VVSVQAAVFRRRLDRGKSDSAFYVLDSVNNSTSAIWTEVLPSG